MAKDNFFKARMTDEQMQTLENIVKEIQANTPEATVTASSIARYALEKYINDYRAKHDGTSIMVNIPAKELSDTDIVDLSHELGILMEKYKSSGNENISKVIDFFNISLLKVGLAKLMQK